MSWTHRVTELAAANLVGIVCLLGAITSIPGIAGVVEVVDRGAPERSHPAAVILGRVRANFRRDLALSLALVVAVALGATSAVTALAYDGGATRVLLVVIVVLVYGIVGVMLAAYAHASGTLDAEASREEVISVAVQHLGGSPLRTLAAAAVVLLALPLWLFAPAALACGITLPTWLHRRIWGPRHHNPGRAWNVKGA